MDNYNDIQVFDWDAEIEHDSEFSYITLPEGDYAFTVSGMSRERYKGSDKLPPCNMAVVSLKFDTVHGKATIKHSLFLTSKTEGMLCDFFTAIGLRKRGEKLSMQWDKVEGTAGVAHVYIDTWTNDKGEEKQNNKIKYFIDPGTEKYSAVMDFKPQEAAPAPTANKWGGARL